MILREIEGLGEQRQWALISQIEHAHLAVEFACNWRFSLLPQSFAETGEAPEVLAELLEAIEHHDDGWADWERMPQLDQHSGRPLSFTEMPLVDSLEIWTKSIQIAEQIGALAAWVVAGHFLWLLENADDSERTTSEAAEAQRWIDEIKVRRESLLARWMRINPNFKEMVARYALQALQFFDAVSLWFCCRCQPRSQPGVVDHEPFQAKWANEVDLSFSVAAENSTTASGADVQNPAQQASPVPVTHAQPWPFLDDRLRIWIPCHTVPVERYSSPQELVAARRPSRLRWLLAAG